MNKQAFQQFVNENINPDFYMEQRLKAKVLSAAPAPSKKRNAKRIWLSVASGVLCLALAFGIFGFAKQNNKILPGSVIIASADAPASIVETVYRYGVAVVDVRGKTEAEASKEWAAKRQVLDSANNTDTVNSSLGHGSNGTENVWLYDVQGDDFEISVENPEDVQEIRMHNENPLLILQYQFLDGEWSEEELFMSTDEADEDYWTEVDTGDEWYMLGKNGEKMDWEEFNRRWNEALHIGHDLTADGERFARARADEAVSGTSSQFEIYLLAADDVLGEGGICDAIEADPDFKLTDIHDVVTFEVEFKNGDVATSVVNVGFNEDGVMIVSLASYEYVKA